MQQVKILQSHVKAAGIEDFPKAVVEHMRALNEHRFTEGEPAPSAPHPLVEYAVARVQHPIEDGKPDDFVPNYDLVDDVTLTTAQKKDALERELNKAVQEWVEKNTVPRRKLALLQHAAAAAAMAPEAQVTSSQAAAIATVELNAKRLTAVHKYIAEQLDAIEDLRDDNIDAWKPAPLPAP